MAPDDRPAPPEPTPLLVLRVSHDSGRTYGPPRVFTTADKLPPLVTSEWPPCECPRHRNR
ncbi:hypothetical protein [Streptomyces antibioticus]|uniref:hypothetical protein n=1 Tax=Streptomyces antibioticus TaxID=1890 RepID=UPI003D745184